MLFFLLLFAVFILKPINMCMQNLMYEMFIIIKTNNYTFYHTAHKNMLRHVFGFFFWEYPMSGISPKFNPQVSYYKPNFYWFGLGFQLIRRSFHAVLFTMYVINIPGYFSEEINVIFSILFF